jgi:23S rRNA (uracil1939-C5)-methyltransferase
VKLTIEKAVYGGAGLARHEGKVVFVPGALPGEQVEAEAARQTSSFAEATLLRVLTPSADRVEAPCPHYGVCGGCQYQHAAYPAQVRMKQGILAETLGRAGLRELPAIAALTAEPWEYRNRIRLHIAPHTHAVGYLQRGSHRLLPIEVCPIAAPLLQQTLRAMQTVAVDNLLGDWCAEAELFTNHDSSAILLSLQGRHGRRAAQPQLDRLCAVLAERVPQLCGAVYTDAEAAPPARRGRGRSAAPRAGAPTGRPLRWGADALTYVAAGSSYRVSAGAFFQANRFLVDTLSKLAMEDARASEHAWDLFAGVGLFAKGLAAAGAQVTAVEGAPESAGDLRANLHGQTVVESSTLSFLQSAAARRGRPDVVLLDPPRAGLGAEATAALTRVRSQTITYVSCDPATLGRDLAALVQAGYTLTRLSLIDLFPQTFHLETVATLRLR